MALTDGYRLAFVIGTALIVAAIGLALALLRAPSAVERGEEPELAADADAAYDAAA